ncbi:trigger factor [Piscinibacter gummiphilus]|uniref:Trigger factor n=1 Tax=Piscinibacter gummiphilus TaxID=946333 RepID=A0A1W6L7T2_9BURK|nr:trigger factor [Piscinibacter gummiphilus]ARN20355.1 trigger factor [Piscinibacter gummiphilus]ATU65028.1 trigger factor [Piscinibacter gummiphilus]GLS98590.1 trigger factor [Piscinibacter gummiphilus]
MAVTVETLEKLERRITLTLAADVINNEVANRLKRLSRTVKADGFRPGKVPMSVVSQRYGYSVQYEVMNDKVGQAFEEATREAKLRVAGAPRITEKENAPEGQMTFDATFEVYPEVKLGDLSTAEVERVSTDVTDAAIDKTVDILRKQRRTFAQRPAGEAAGEGDRVTIDFEGKIDGVPFDGGKAEGFQFLIGEGQMLEQFEKAVRGMKAGESKTFPLQFPEDYQGKDVAGKEADFLVTVNKIEVQNLPVVDEAFAKSLGIADGTVDALRADIKKNLEREVKFRVLARNKGAVMDALVKTAELDLPTALVNGEIERMVEAARADLKKRGVKDADNAPIPSEIFKDQAERRVRLGLVVGELVRANNLSAKPEQLQAHIEEISQSYEKPAEVVRWYLSDRQRMAEVEGVVIENNVAEFVLGKAKVSDKALPFDELMAG